MNPKKAAPKKAPAKRKPTSPALAVAENIMDGAQRIGIRFAWNPAVCRRSVRAKTLAAHHAFSEAGAK